MIKVGDRVEILSTGRVGIIIGEGTGVWKIDFIDGDKPESVIKNTPMRVITVTPNPNPNPNPSPKKRWGWKRWLWTIGVILFIAGTLYLTIKNSL
jgi:hypothetical protein